MAKPLKLITESNVPFNNGGLKFSTSIMISEIESHEKFQGLFQIDDALLERITQNIKENGFDASQPVHIWVVTDESGAVQHNYLIDGYTRLEAAKRAELKSIPCFKHRTFANVEEAYLYSIHLQTDRRNLNDGELLKFLTVLMGTDYVQSLKGNKAQFVADNLGVSKATAKKAMSVYKNATDEQKERIENNEASINQIYNENHPKRGDVSDSAESEENLPEETEEQSSNSFAQGQCIGRQRRVCHQARHFV